jgi:hypothetical protein
MKEKNYTLKLKRYSFLKEFLQKHNIISIFLKNFNNEKYGFGWRNKQISNNSHDILDYTRLFINNKINLQTYCEHAFADYFTYAFHWSETSQGHEFWSEINKLWKGEFYDTFIKK